MDYGMTPLEGGYSGETFLATSAGERSVVRVYAGRGAQRGAGAVEVDAAVLRLVRGLLPVPRVLELRRPDPAAGTPALLVTSFLPGERLEVAWPRLRDDVRHTVAAALGAALGRLAGVPMLRPGRFADADLRIERWPGAADLVGFVEERRVGSALADWSEREYGGLLAAADRAQDLLDRVERSCLVHSDFNAKNLLVDAATGAVTGVVDWEFAHAGAPGADLGNLLRFDRDPLLVEGVLDSYLDVTAGLDGLDRARLLDQARAADLAALMDLAARRGENPVTERADAQLRAVARDADLHAVP
ncbi:phosphotransferase family protein [Nocardioides mesophilus]|uniref:phosphotransferase family protein n=1 Tax=Nocardioides mesophilus TaxID=433659 RepID=UPI001FEB156A|nr:phosphotransferase [Nocardioides mesophilus]